MVSRRAETSHRRRSAYSTRHDRVESEPSASRVSVLKSQALPRQDVDEVAQAAPRRSHPARWCGGLDAVARLEPPSSVFARLEMLLPRPAPPEPSSPRSAGGLARRLFSGATRPSMSFEPAAHALVLESSAEGPVRSSLDSISPSAPTEPGESSRPSCPRRRSTHDPHAADGKRRDREEREQEINDHGRRTLEIRSDDRAPEWVRSLADGQERSSPEPSEAAPGPAASLDALRSGDRRAAAPPALHDRGLRSGRTCCYPRDRLPRRRWRQR